MSDAKHTPTPAELALFVRGIAEYERYATRDAQESEDKANREILRDIEQEAKRINGDGSMADVVRASHDALVAALADARMRFANFADAFYAMQDGKTYQTIHESWTDRWRKEAQQGRDACEAALKAAKGAA